MDCCPQHSFFLTSKTRAGKDLDCDSQSFQFDSKIAHGPVDTCVAMVLNDAVLYLIKLTSRFISANKAPSIRPAMKTGTNLTACQSEFLRQFLLGASGFYLYTKEAQNERSGAIPILCGGRTEPLGIAAPCASASGVPGGRNYSGNKYK
jgi:hypothetical protein